MKKFWNKADATNEIFIYGDIASDKFLDTDTTAKLFVDDLKSFKGKDLTVHVNSSGGDVFTALAIYNSIKNYSGKTTILIDGLAASAASIICCAGDTVKMAANAIYMVHPPAVGLVGFYDAAELGKVANSLNAVKDSILTTYETRTKRPRADLEKMVDAETWLSADEALAGNFIDEITGAVDAQFDNNKKLIFMNKIELSCANIDFEKVKAATHAAEREVPMEDLKQQIAAAVQAERKRITDLNALKCENAAVNNIIDLAVADGKTPAEIQPYVDAVKSVAPPPPPPVQNTNTGFEELKKLILDNMQSGAEGVAGSVPSPNEQEKIKAQASLLAQYTNSYLKGGAKQ